ncbi:tail sheath monomer [Synechococcus phage S-E7]|nr:tail sheath monomer [Synechococcus phage S-E7]
MAANQLSPGVVIQERDLTTITTLSTANIGVLAAPFELGPVEEIVEIASERDLVEVFGKPNDSNYEFWYTASQFLSYGGLLKTIRVTSSNLKNAVDQGTAPLIKNLQSYETTFESATNNWNYAARTPGAKGNSIGIFVTDAGPDQILVTPTPTTNEFEFDEDTTITATGAGDTGASGKVFRYSIVLTVNDVVGDFVPGVASIQISDAQAMNILSWDPANKRLEIEPDADGISGVIAAGQTITQSSTNTCDVVSIERRIYVQLDKGSVEFAAGDAFNDNNSQACTIASVRSEYAEREYLPGEFWVNSAPRPTTSLYANSVGGHRDEMHILVIDVDGKITGTTGAVLERFIGVSKASDAKTSVGETNYYVEVLKQRSQYLFWGEHETGAALSNATSTAADGNFGQTANGRQFNLFRSDAGSVSHPSGRTTLGTKNGSTYYYRLTSGADYGTSGGVYDISATDVTTAYSLCEDPESQTIDYILTGPSGADDAAALAKVTSLVNIAEERRDCMVFASPRRGNVIGLSNTTTITNNIVGFFDLLPSSSYLVFDSGYKYIYDKYNDVYRYVPCNGDVAGLCLQTTEVAEPWFSPAGFQRGVLRNAIKLAYSPTKTQRDKLYASRINPIVSFPGQGVVLFGDKTALGFASAFDRINVRRLFLTIERVISGAAKAQLFEQNDESQRSLFLNIVEPYLREVQGRRGVTDFLVKCDQSNNPPEAVDRGEFFAEIFVKPTRTINYITLTFVATRTGVAFQEVAN